jgi:hypothetical protein
MSCHVSDVLHYAQSISVVTAIVHAFNEVVCVTLVKHWVIRKAKALVMADNQELLNPDNTRDNEI